MADPVVVVDWKSDVNPDAQTLDHYRAQVRAYLDMTGAERGLIVLMTGERDSSSRPRRRRWRPDGGRNHGLPQAPTGSSRGRSLPEIELLLPARLAIDGKVLEALCASWLFRAARALPTAPFAIRRVAGHETTTGSADAEGHQREDGHAIGSRSHSPCARRNGGRNGSPRRSNWVKAGG